MIDVDKIELWKAKKQIAVKKASYHEGEFERRVLIEEGEVVEYRYHHSVHFRTQDNVYCVLDEKTFYEFFEPYGKIFASVRFANKCELKDILEHNLFEYWQNIKNYDKYKEVETNGR